MKKPHISKIKVSAIQLIALSLLLSKPVQVFAQIREWDNPDGVLATPDSCLINGIPTLKCLEVVTGNLLFMSNALILLVLFVMFVIGSYRWMMSFGQQDKIESAKKTFTWAIIGLILYVSSYLILFTIDQLFLGGSGSIFRLQIGL